VCNNCKAIWILPQRNGMELSEIELIRRGVETSWIIRPHVIMCHMQISGEHLWGFTCQNTGVKLRKAIVFHDYYNGVVFISVNWHICSLRPRFKAIDWIELELIVIGNEWISSAVSWNDEWLQMGNNKRVIIVMN